MKTIGTTNTGNFMVEMERDEYYEMLRLEESIQGDWISSRGNFRGVNLSPVFKALGDLATAKSNIKNLQDYITNLAEYFGKIEIPKEINDG